MALFGKDFSLGADSLVVLATCHLFGFFAGPANSVLRMAGHSRLGRTNTVVFAIALITANAVAILIGGVLGAVVIVSNSYLLLGIIRMAQVWRLHGIHPFSWSSAKPLIAGVLTAVMLVGVKLYADAAYYPALALLAAIVYLGLLYVLGLDKDDRVFIQEILSKLKGDGNKGWTSPNGKCRVKSLSSG